MTSLRGPIRVLIADDSMSMREALKILLAADGDIVVVGEAKDGAEAVSLAVQTAPDVITMDVLMPRLNGLEATQRIMASAPSRILLVCAVGDEGGVDLSFRAMDVGALELIAKPTMQSLHAWGADLRQSVRLMAEVPVVRRWRSGPATTPSTMPPSFRVGVVGIAASTGGPPALASLLGRLPADFPTPIVIAQHMANGFVAGLHRWLTEVSALPVQIARDGMMLARGAVYLAPDGSDLELQLGGALRVLPSASHHTPSGDRLLESLARVYRTRALGVVLTGMGDDGTRGLAAIRAAGGHTIAQDEASSVVFGMPKAAATAGVVDQMVSLSAMPALILDLVGKERA
ncbi:MAG: chemotaxis-specific protein-glutamate methyltransferase CheB [Polyangiaceae bacterium]